MASAQSTYGFVSNRNEDLSDKTTVFSTTLKTLAILPASKFSDSGDSVPDSAASSVPELLFENGTVVYSPPEFVRYLSSAYSDLGKDEAFDAEFAAAGARYKSTTTNSNGVSCDLWMLFDSNNPSRQIDIKAETPSVWLFDRESGTFTKAVFSVSAWKRNKLSLPGKEGFRTFYAMYGRAGVQNSTCCIVSETASWYGSATASEFTTAEDKHLTNIGSIQEGTRGATTVGGTRDKKGFLVQLNADGLIDESLLPSSYEGFASALAEEREARELADEELSTALSNHKGDEGNPHGVKASQIVSDPGDKLSFQQAEATLAGKKVLVEGDLAPYIKREDAEAEFAPIGAVGDIASLRSDLATTNSNVDALGQDLSGVHDTLDDHAAEMSRLDEKIDTKANASDVYSKEDVYTKHEVDGRIDDKLSGRLDSKAVAIGENAEVSHPSGVAVGADAEVSSDSVAVGTGAKSYSFGSVALGQNAHVSGDKAIQLGDGINASNGTLQFRAWPLVDATGFIEDARIQDNIVRAAALDAYLKTSDAASIYLAKEDAEDTYLTIESAGTIYLSKTDAENTYLSKADAEDTYLSKADAGNTYIERQEVESDYLKKTDAVDTYLPKADAETTYLSKGDASDTYLAKQDAEDTYLAKQDAENTYLPKVDAEAAYLSKADAADTYATKTELANTNAELDSTAESINQHIAASNPHGITKDTIGLGNVDNTSDADKPLSSAAVAALALKADDDAVYKKSETYDKAGAESMVNSKIEEAITGSGYATTTYVNNAVEAEATDRMDADQELLADIQAEATARATKDSQIDQSISDINSSIASIENQLPTFAVASEVASTYATKTELSSGLSGKQDALVAGTNIVIDPSTNTISATLTVDIDDDVTENSSNAVKSSGIYSAIESAKSATLQAANSALDTRVAPVEGRLDDVEDVIPTLVTESLLNETKTELEGSISGKQDAFTVGGIITLSGGVLSAEEEDPVFSEWKDSSPVEIGESVSQTEAVAESVLVGKNVSSASGKTVAVGSDISCTRGSDNVAVGSSVSVTGNGENVVIGSRSSTSGGRGVVVAASGRANGFSSVAIGANAIANGDFSVQIGDGVNGSDKSLQFMDCQLFRVDSSGGKFNEAYIPSTIARASDYYSKAETAEMILDTVVQEIVDRNLVDEATADASYAPKIIRIEVPNPDPNLPSTYREVELETYVRDEKQNKLVAGNGITINARTNEIAASITETDPAFVAWITGDSVAAGAGATCYSSYSVSIGGASTAGLEYGESDDYSISIGHSSFSSNDGIAIGKTSRSDSSGIAIGVGARSRALNAIQLGPGENVTQDSLQVLNTQILVGGALNPSLLDFSAINPINIGTTNETTYTKNGREIVIGRDSIAAVGYTSSGYAAVCIGDGTYVYGSNIGIGRNNTVGQTSSFKHQTVVVGNGNVVTGGGDFVIGYQRACRGASNIVLGNRTGNVSYAEDISGDNSNYNILIGSDTHLGNTTISSAIAIGNRASASSGTSIAIGYQAESTNGGVQLGEGTETNGGLQFKNYPLLTSDGKIVAGRLDNTVALKDNVYDKSQVYTKTEVEAAFMPKHAAVNRYFHTASSYNMTLAPDTREYYDSSGYDITVTLQSRSNIESDMSREFILIVHNKGTTDITVSLNRSASGVTTLIGESEYVLSRAVVPGAYAEFVFTEITKNDYDHTLVVSVSRKDMAEIPG